MQSIKKLLSLEGQKIQEHKFKGSNKFYFVYTHKYQRLATMFNSKICSEDEGDVFGFMCGGMLRLQDTESCISPKIKQVD